MMNAPALSLPQMPTQTGLASILAALGAGAPATGEGGGFEQLLAAAPATGAVPAQDAAAPVPIELLLPVEGAAPPPVADVIAIDPAAQPVDVSAEPVDTEAATDAANLLIALIGTVPGTAPAASKPVPVTPGETETDAPADADTTGAMDKGEAPVMPVLIALPVTVAAPANKPVKPAEAAATAPRGDMPALSAAAKPQGAVQPMPAPVLAPVEAPVARPADGGAAMTLLFTQPAAPGAPGAVADTVAQPTVVAERVLDMTSDDVWIEQLARDIVATKSGSGDISFRLMPRHLGRLDVAMQMGSEGVSLKLDTQHEATATIVTAAQGRLVEDLRQQGVRVAGAEVTCTPGETGRQSQQGQGRGAATPDAAHLIETATEHAETRDEDRTADRRGRFA